jgi:hypothetical protein
MPAVDITDVLDLSDMAAQIMGEHYAPAAPHHSAHSADDEDDGLLPRSHRLDARFTGRAGDAGPARRGAPDRPLGRDLARRHGAQMLRPMLAEWLERNLPGMVEKMVAAEIARIAGKRG